MTDNQTEDAKDTSKPGHRDSDMYGISRKSRSEGGQKAWSVRLSRGGRLIQTTFSDSTYGGRAASLYVARAYRDAVLEIVPPLTRAEMRQVTRKKAGDHISQIAGVTYAKATKGRSDAWVARIELPSEEMPGRPTTGDKRPRRSKTRRFSVARLGYEAAKAAAEDARLDMLEALQDADAPALRSPAAERLHKRLGNKAEKDKG